MSHSNGDYYDGDWVDDKKHGNGRYYNYYQEYKNIQTEISTRDIGQIMWKVLMVNLTIIIGNFIYANGSNYKGELMDCKKNGKGIFE